MDFHVTSTFLYILAIGVILFVLAQSFFFLVRAYRRGIAIGMEKAKLKKVILSTTVFTIAPAISILLGVVTLSKVLGIPLPWIRLSVIGALTYEIPAASAAVSAFGVNFDTLKSAITDPKMFSAVAWVMTLGILPSIILCPILMKKIQSGLVKIKNKDSHWGDIFMTSLFLGMISAFLGMVFGDVRKGLVGLIPIFVLLFSGLLMAICGLLIKKCKMAWLETYAMAISMLGAMAFACVITPIIV